MEKQPKKTRNVFFIYLEANKARFLQQASGVHKQAVSLCSKDWQVLSKDDRAPYEEKAKAAKKQYDEDVKAFTDGGGAMKQCKASEGRERKKRGRRTRIRTPAPSKTSGWRVQLLPKCHVVCHCKSIQGRSNRCSG